MKNVITEYLETIKEIKEFLNEHEIELYADESKRSLYSDVLNLEKFLKNCEELYLSPVGPFKQLKLNVENQIQKALKEINYKKDNVSKKKYLYLIAYSIFDRNSNSYYYNPEDSRPTFLGASALIVEAESQAQAVEQAEKNLDHRFLNIITSITKLDDDTNLINKYFYDKEEVK